MTLSESRSILLRLRDRPSTNPLVAEALDIALAFIPEESPRPSAESRLEYIRSCIRAAKDGFDPFSSRGRGYVTVCWRHCVWLLMSQEGYRSTEIARATNYNHATVWWGLSRLRGYISSGDHLTLAIWRDLNTIMNNG